MTTKDADILTLDAIVDNCDELLRLARAQYLAIVGNNADQLRALLDQRERLISSFDLSALGRQMADPAAAGKLSSVMEKLREVLRSDAESRKALQDWLGQLNSQTRDILQGRVALLEHFCPRS